MREKAGDHKEVFEPPRAPGRARRRRRRHPRASATPPPPSRARSSATTPRPSTSTARSSRTSRATRKASTALRELYAKVGKHKELLALLSRLIDLAETPEARTALRLEAAAICIDKLDAVTEATEHLRAVLDEDQGNEKATLLLSQLLEKSGRDQELAELLSSQIELAQGQGALEKELAFRVRLGEVYETRLNDIPQGHRDVPGGRRQGGRRTRARSSRWRASTSSAARRPTRPRRSRPCSSEVRAARRR